jgi:tRNA G18 (ribose-2'-O)-methylase SpoU
MVLVRKKRIVCENLRSAYNVWNIIRTADGLGRWVILLGYTAPKEHKKVVKTALWAEESVELLKFDTLELFYDRIKNNQILLLSAERTDTSIWLHTWWERKIESDIAVVMGNEVTWVEKSTLDLSDYIVHIPMVGEKESFNVGQAAAIMMREVNKLVWE